MVETGYGYTALTETLIQKSVTGMHGSGSCCVMV
jgi:hypothetical protein